jgi:hypothetical protein
VNTAKTTANTNKPFRKSPIAFLLFRETDAKLPESPGALRTR